jgi:hypothetical protein
MHLPYLKMPENSLGVAPLTLLASAGGLAAVSKARFCFPVLPTTVLELVSPFGGGVDTKCRGSLTTNEREGQQSWFLSLRLDVSYGRLQPHLRTSTNSARGTLSAQVSLGSSVGRRRCGNMHYVSFLFTYKCSMARPIIFMIGEVHLCCEHEASIYRKDRSSPS